MKRLIGASVLGIATVLASASAVEAVPPPRGGCTVDIYWELDANGILTAYPAANCAPQQTFNKVVIDSTLQKDGRWVATGKTTRYGRTRGRVLPGAAVSTRNTAGNNEYCAIVNVYWQYSPPSGPDRKRTGESCVNY